MTARWLVPHRMAMYREVSRRWSEAALRRLGNLDVLHVLLRRTEEEVIEQEGAWDQCGVSSCAWVTGLPITRALRRRGR